MVREHGDALEADMQREYGIELADIYRGKLSLRRLRVLVDGLPVDCRTARLLGDVDDELLPWTMTSALLARLVDELAALRWEYEAVHVDKRDRREPPKSVMPTPKSAAVIELVKPHQLGDFMSDFSEGV